jgi:hypothetical protein
MALFALTVHADRQSQAFVLADAIVRKVRMIDAVQMRAIQHIKGIPAPINPVPL